MFTKLLQNPKAFYPINLEKMTDSNLILANLMIFLAIIVTKRIKNKKFQKSPPQKRQASDLFNLLKDNLEYLPLEKA